MRQKNSKKSQKQSIPSSPGSREALQGRVHPQLAVESNHLRFSFKYLESNHGKFDYSEQKGLYFRRFLDRLKTLSSTKLIEAMSSRGRTLRCHTIKWDKDNVSEDGFMNLPDHLQDVDAHQFSVGKKHGRVHGFILPADPACFYIVWLDPDHKLYPGRQA